MQTVALLACCVIAVGAIKTIHVVPHSHLDVGWVYPVDEVYESYVKDVFRTTVAALSADDRRTFICVEQAFFARWWLNVRQGAQVRLSHAWLTRRVSS